MEFTKPLSITSNAVRSYRTLSPLPVPEGHRRSALCCTGRRFTPPRRYLAPCPVEPGLSSPRTVCSLRTNPSSDCPVNSGTDYNTQNPSASAKRCAAPTPWTRSPEHLSLLAPSTTRSPPRPCPRPRTQDTSMLAAPPLREGTDLGPSRPVTLKLPSRPIPKSPAACAEHAAPCGPCPRPRARSTGRSLL